jgi:aminoglycoside 3-N-acetyltransferase
MGWTVPHGILCPLGIIMLEGLKNMLYKISPTTLQWHKNLYPKYSTVDLISMLKSLGIKKGSCLFIHSGWSQFYNFQGNPKELIEAILDEIGPEGTLAMPAFPFKQDPSVVFDVKKTPSGAGYLTEILRRFPNVKRSINLMHSVCAIGSQSDFLTKDHHHSITPWDKNSPYYRLKEIDALILGLGVGKHLSTATCLHCVESLLKDKLPFFSNIFKSEITYQYRDYDNNINSHKMYVRISSKLDTKKISKYMDKKIFNETKISNLDIFSIPARYLIDRTLELAKQGITMYVIPEPKKELFIPFNQNI